MRRGETAGCPGTDDVVVVGVASSVVAGGVGEVMSGGSVVGGVPGTLVDVVAPVGAVASVEAIGSSASTADGAEL